MQKHESLRTLGFLQSKWDVLSSDLDLLTSAQVDSVTTILIVVTMSSVVSLLFLQNTDLSYLHV